MAAVMDERMSTRSHELVTAGNLRWCLGCTLFQSRRGPGAVWYPAGVESGSCPSDGGRRRALDGASVTDTRPATVTKGGNAV